MAKRRGILDDIRRTRRLPALDESEVSSRGESARRRAIGNRLKNILDGGPKEAPVEEDSPRVYGDDDEETNE